MMITYSINKASYILSRGCEIVYKLGEKDKICYICDEPLAEVYAEEYENDEELRAFLNAFKEIREQTRQLKNKYNIK